MKLATAAQLRLCFNQLWVEYGNGFGTPYEKLIAEMQRHLDDEQPRLDRAWEDLGNTLKEMGEEETPNEFSA